MSATRFDSPKKVLIGLSCQMIVFASDTFGELFGGSAGEFFSTALGRSLPGQGRTESALAERFSVDLDSHGNGVTK